ncbi:hypothetical protein [Tepidibacter hydrothermalis]|uniref:Uncharacterized protein n=1 Tax=Tepidibacter hydrothermalis TaxID=3036126 RepID=A0ABY8E721_9FIRM|nr:hypothetical protein [Tepidibacter hydrothermalis]WFD08693.1 hypothetical protein P4S50_09790 [Tepidibacter hydrothermalis]
MTDKEIEFKLKKFKKKVLSLVEQKNMFSIMNNTNMDTKNYRIQ